VSSVFCKRKDAVLDYRKGLGNGMRKVGVAGMAFITWALGIWSL